MKVRVDCHTHWVQPRHFSEAAAAEWAGQSGYQGWPSTTPEEFTAATEMCETAVVFGISAPRAGLHVPNEEVAAIVAEAPERRIGLMALDPLAPGAIEEIERCTNDLGMRGIKFYPVLAGFDPLDRSLGPVYSLAERLGLPILWHMGATPVASGRLKLSQPLLLDDIAVEFPRLRMVIAHLGHPWQRDAIMVVRKNPNVFADVSGLWHRPWQGYEALVACQEWGITDKLLFGSDYPLWSPADGVSGLRELNDQIEGTHLPRVDDEVIESLFTRDSLALLGIDR